MRRIAFLSALLFALPVQAAEVLVGVTATSMLTPSSVMALIQNLGPNPIYCQRGNSTGLAVSKGVEIRHGGSWKAGISSSVPIYCITSVLQVTGAATVVYQGTDFDTDNPMSPDQAVTVTVSGIAQVDPSVSTSILQGHLDPDAAGTVLRSTLAGWRSVFLYNDSTVNCCVGLDAQGVTTTAGGKCTKGTPLKVGDSVSRDYGFPYQVDIACSGATDATTGADIAYEITK